MIRRKEKRLKAAHKAPEYCKRPELPNCRGCNYSYAPNLYDGGCRLRYSDIVAENQPRQEQPDDNGDLCIVPKEG